MVRKGTTRILIDLARQDDPVGEIIRPLRELSRGDWHPRGLEGLVSRRLPMQLGVMPEQAPKKWRHAQRAGRTKPPVQVRFTAHSGEVWTVWDTTFSKFKHRRHAHCDEAARARVFVNVAGVKRSYTFKKNESRVLVVELLNVC